MTRQDAADLLGIPSDAPSHLIHQAYRQQCPRLHPDGGGAASQFHLLTKARDILLRDSRVPQSEPGGRRALNPGVFPLWSYPLRLSIAAIRDPKLRGRAVRTWMVTVIGLPLAYLAVKDLLMLSVVPLLALVVALALFRRFS